MTRFAVLVKSRAANGRRHYPAPQHHERRAVLRGHARSGRFIAEVLSLCLLMSKAGLLLQISELLNAR